MRFQCQNCTHIVTIDDTERGQPVGCGHCGGITVVPSSRFAKDAVIGDFIIRETLGHGGMGTVYLAHQHSLDRPVALKILMEQFSRNGDFVTDFVREARAAAKLTHPNIVQSYAVGEDDGVYYFAMEYVEGKTLKTILAEQKKLPWQQALTIIQQIAEALDFAWKNQQLVHRDIKPDNIMLTNRGIAKLADLGLARAAQETMDDDDEVMGTPQYICPEQLLGQPMDVRGDIYSLGATLFHALGGHFPFDGHSAAEIARKHLNEPVPDPRQYDSSIPPECTYVVRKMMAKKLEDRYEDAEELVVDIGLILRGQKPVGFNEAGAAKGKTAHGRAGLKPAPAGRPRPATHTGKKGTRGGSRPESGSHPAMPAPAQVSHRQPVSPTAAGGKKMSVKQTGRVKMSSKTQSRITGGSTSSGTYQPPRGAAARAAKQGGSGKGAVVFLLIVVLALAGAITWVIVQIKTYNFETTALAKRHYLEYAALPDERSAFLELEPFLDSSKNIELKDAQRIYDLARNFLATFPRSLFANYAPKNLDHNQTFYAKQFKVPFEAAVFAKNIGRVADSDPAPASGQRRLAGLVLWNRDGRITEAFVRYLRSQDKPAEEQMISVNEAEYDFTEEKKKVLDELSTYVTQMTEEYRAKKQELVAIVSQNLQKWNAERDECRNAVLALTKELKFPEGLDSLKTFKAKEATYTNRVGPPIRNFMAQSPREKANAKLKEFTRRFINIPNLGRVEEWKRSVTLDALTEQFTKYGTEKGLDAEIKEILEQDPKEAKIFADRRFWYEHHETALALCTRYNELVANVKDDVPGGYHIKMRTNKPSGLRIDRELVQGNYIFKKLKYETGDQIFILAILRYEMVVQAWRYNKDAKILPVETENIPLLEILRVGVFEAVAAEAGKLQNLTDLDLIHACHEFYVRPALARPLLDKQAADESAKFLVEELGALPAAP